MLAYLKSPDGSQLVSPDGSDIIVDLAYETAAAVTLALQAETLAGVAKRTVPA